GVRNPDVIKKENLDFFLVQVFGKPALDPEEFQTLAHELSGESNRIYLSGRGSAMKPYLLGACLPGVMVAAYGEGERARQAHEGLASHGIGAVLLPQEPTTDLIERVLIGVADGSAKILLLPDMLIADQVFSERLHQHVEPHGFNFVVAHDLLIGEG